MSLTSLIVLGNILLTSVAAAPVSHGRNLHPPLSTSGQRQGHLLLGQSISHAQVLHHQDPHTQGSHQIQEDAEKWADSLIVDPTDDLHQGSPHPRSPSQQQAIVSTMHQAGGHQLSQSHAEKLKELERFLDLDEDHELAFHRSPGKSTSFTHIPSPGRAETPAAPNCDLLGQSSGVSPTSYAVTQTNKFGRGSHAKRKASRIPVVSPPLRRYRPFWGRDFDPGVKLNIKRALDKMAIAKWGKPTSKRRHLIVNSMTREQIVYLGKGLPPENLPPADTSASPASHAIQIKAKRPIDLSTPRRKGPWTKGLTFTQIETIHEFGDEVMAERGADSVSLKNTLIQSLSRQELLDVADKKQEERRVIKEKLAPKKRKPGPRPRTDADDTAVQ